MQKVNIEKVRKYQGLMPDMKNFIEHKSKGGDLSN